MPPFLPRKRSPPVSLRPTPTKRARLADALDGENINRVVSLARAKTFSLGSDDSSSDSSLSDVDSDQFEDVELRTERIKDPKHNKEDDGEDDDENVEWEDAAPVTPRDGASAHVPMANGPIQITLRHEDDVVDYGTAAKAGSGKKGPSKREKQVRIMTHQLHVQFLLWHNAIRNSWIGDRKVQETLVKQLPPQILREVEKWRRSSGLVVAAENSDKPKVKGKKRRQPTEADIRGQRDWGQPSQRLEVGKPDMSSGDPLITLMKVLSAYWKKRFAITAPGLRKRGYGTKHSLKLEIASYRRDEHDPERHGERIRNVPEFRKMAQRGAGSRDAGAQLFTALLRGLGIEARLVASLQPSGYGWTKVEQMLPRKPNKTPKEASSSDDDDAVPTEVRATSSSKTQTRKPARKSQVINLDTDVEGEESATADEVDIKEDDDSVVDLTPSMPKQRRAKYDRDLGFPVYWTEVVSPITSKVLPVSPLVLENSVATTPETLSVFEPRGAKAEKGRQVMAYVVAYATDGSAKDVTVRYLRKQVWPGKTKGFRIPIEKVPVYDARGKVKRSEDYDWFKQILGPYRKDNGKRTAADKLEDSTDLVPQHPEKKTEEEGSDTLSSLKASADYVLERFLRREEALRPDAEPVRTFISGKGDNYKEEAVYRRADVERCLTAESWHKEGRRPNVGEAPMKMVPVRAVTLTRKREAEEHERRYGEKQMQGLYAWDQTEWIIPPPIEDGVIPKNAYGNMDCFVPSMVPKGAVHIPLKGTTRVCKKLEIDFAEAVTGFEFGNKRAVPVCTGVVVAIENERLVRDAWRDWNEEQRRKEETKMEKLVLDLWRKFVLGLRIRERVQDMYGEDIGVIEDVPTGLSREDAIAIDDDNNQQDGGFVNEEYRDEEMGGGFLLPHEEIAAPMEDLIVEDNVSASQSKTQPDTQIPISAPKKTATTLKSKPSKSHSLTAIEQSDLTDESSSTSGKSESPEARSTSIAAKNSHPMPNVGRRKFHHPAESVREESEDDLDSNTEASSLEQSPINTPSHVTNSEDGDSPSNSDSDENADGDDDDDEQIYTPRPTRTRTVKPTPVARQTRTAKSSSKPNIAKHVRAGPKVKTKRGLRSKQNVSNATGEPDENSVLSENDGRGRRGSRKKTTHAPDTPKRSTRLMRKESTVVTSPYFEH